MAQLPHLAGILEDSELSVIAAQVAKALKAELSRRKSGTSVQRFRPGQLALQLGDDVVGITSGIYDTGCDITVITRSVVSRLQEKTARWIENNWTKFDLNGRRIISTRTTKCSSSTTQTSETLKQLLALPF